VLRMAATSRLFYKWFQHDNFTEIVLVKEQDSGSTSVIWAGVPVGGMWDYTFAAGVGVLHIEFNCKGDPLREKDHRFIQVEGTSVYKLQPVEVITLADLYYSSALLIPMEMDEDIQ
jgi:hypothetical protein